MIRRDTTEQPSADPKWHADSCDDKMGQNQLAVPCGHPDTRQTEDAMLRFPDEMFTDQTYHMKA